MKSTFVLITRSYKYGGYCIAGIDPATKGWVRFVSGTSPADNEIPKYFFEPFNDLDILEVETLGAVPYGCQTENLLLDLGVKPVRHGRLSFYELLSPAYLEAAPTVFGNTLSHLTEAEIDGRRGSLGLFSVDALRFDYALRDDGKIHFRCSFRYMGAVYSDVSVTDPVYRKEEFAGETLERALIVVSLPAIPYSNERYYKFIAKIFPLTADEARRVEVLLRETNSAQGTRPAAHAETGGSRKSRAEAFLLSLAEGRDPDTGGKLDPARVLLPAYAARFRECAALVAKQEEAVKKREKKKTYLLRERIAEIAITDEAVTASTLKDRVNSVREPYGKSLTAHAVIEFFAATGMVGAGEGQGSRKFPTDLGRQYGVRTEERMSMRGFRYFTVLYGRRAQQFFSDNIEQIVEVIEKPMERLAGESLPAPRPWNGREETLLIREFAARLTLEEIARRHKRPIREIADRLKKLGVEL